MNLGPICFQCHFEIQGTIEILEQMLKFKKKYCGLKLSFLMHMCFIIDKYPYVECKKQSKC